MTVHQGLILYQRGEVPHTLYTQLKPASYSGIVKDATGMASCAHDSEASCHFTQACAAFHISCTKFKRAPTRTKSTEEAADHHKFMLATYFLALNKPDVIPREWHEMLSGFHFHGALCETYSGERMSMVLIQDLQLQRRGVGLN